MTNGPSPAVRVLIVDDDEVDRMAVRRALRASGEQCTFAEADDVSSALEALRHGSFDCAFLDFQIPGGDGLELLRQARDAGVSTPIVMLTGVGDEQVAVELMKAGASDYLPKSALSPERLRRSLHYAMRLRAADAVVRRSTAQLRGLTDAALAISATLDVPSMAGAAASHARRLLGARWALAVVQALGSEHQAMAADDAAGWDPTPEVLHAVGDRLRASGDPLRVTRSRIASDPAYADLASREPADPLRQGWVAVRLRGRHGESLGLLLAVDREDGEFTESDEAILVQLAQLASAALENARLYEEAQAAARARDDILAVVSHDLRNPVGAIQMAAEFLIGSAPPDDRRVASRRQLQVIRRGATSALRLIQDLLDVSRIDAGRLVLDRGPVDPRRLVHDAIEGSEALAEADGITVEETIAADLPMVHGDDERLLQALGNLLGNALKFTPRGGLVNIAAERVGADSTPAVRFAVRDTGPGIAPEDLPHIFDRFWQGRAGERGGAGLGLAIVRGIVEAHGGQVHVESIPGQGTTVAFSIPVAGGRRE